MLKVEVVIKISSQTFGPYSGPWGEYLKGNQLLLAFYPVLEWVSYLWVGFQMLLKLPSYHISIDGETENFDSNWPCSKSSAPFFFFFDSWVVGSFLFLPTVSPLSRPDCVQMLGWTVLHCSWFTLGFSFQAFMNREWVTMSVNKYFWALVMHQDTVWGYIIPTWLVRLLNKWLPDLRE